MTSSLFELLNRRNKYFKLNNNIESTFTIKPSELNNDFLESLQKLFKYSRQQQITVSTSEDFGLLEPETPFECLARLEKIRPK